MKRTLLPLLLFLLTPVLALAQMAYVAGDVLVMLRPGASATKVAEDLREVGGKATGLRVVKEVSAPMRAWLLHFDGEGVGQELMLRSIQRHPAIQLAQNNHIVEERDTPNDPGFATQWHHERIQSEQAWDITTGGLTSNGDTIVVCIVENANLPHPDLVDNAWYNHDEIPNNGIDDDGNGFIDDHRGWNAEGNDDDVYGGGHGTQVAGMIGAKGDNGVAVAGINWDVKMMVVTYQSTNEAHVLAAYTYPLVMRRLYNGSGGDKGAFVVATNASWGVNFGDPAAAPLWCAMYDTLGTAGVLNCGATANLGIDIDEEGDLPTGCASDFMVSVTNTTSADVRNNGAAWGATTIDLGAPGTQVVTTALNGGTTSTTGTSFSSPLTAGLIGLLYSTPCSDLMDLVASDPQAGALYVRQALFEGVDPIPSLQGNSVTGGRINAFNSVNWIMGQCGSCPAPYDLAATSDQIGQADITWSALTLTEYTLRYRPVDGSIWTEVTDIASMGHTVEGLDACTAYEFQVSADCDSVASEFGPSIVLITEGCCNAPAATVASVSPGSVTLALVEVLAAGSYDVRYREVGGAVWQEINGITDDTVEITGLLPCSELEFEVRSHCDGEQSEWTAGAPVHVTGCDECVDGNFCASEGGTNDEWIERFRMADIDHTSGNDDGYGDFTGSISTLLVPGADYPATFTPGYTGTNYSEAWSLFIDRNEDGDFTMDERIFATASAEAGEQEATVTIPEGHPQGQFRMRLVMQYDEAMESGCGTFDFGEVEDYCATVTMSIGLDEPRPTGAHLWPVPADRWLNIDAGTATPGSLLLVFDGAGRVVMQQQLTDRLTTLNTAQLPAGSYLYRITHTDALPMTGRFHVLH